MKKWCLFLLVMALAGSPLYAGILDSLSIGLGGGYDSYNTLRGELYLKSDIKLFKRQAEIKAGFNNRSYQLEFDRVEGLKAESVGLFGDIAVYPFNKGLFAGLRWELINFNWLSPDSEIKIQNERNYSPTSFYTGTCIFFQLGYHFQFSNKWGIKLYGQPGFQQFKISNGLSSSGSYSQGPPVDNLITEDHYEFIYNVNISVEFRIR